MKKIVGVSYCCVQPSLTLYGSRGPAERKNHAHSAYDHVFTCEESRCALCAYVQMYVRRGAGFDEFGVLESAVHKCRAGTFTVPVHVLVHVMNRVGGAVGVAYMYIHVGGAGSGFGWNWLSDVSTQSRGSTCTGTCTCETCWWCMRYGRRI